MIPVPKECLILLEIRNIPEYEQKRRVNDELAFCRRKIDAIKKQAEKSFAAITNTKNERIIKNSCDFRLLQSSYILYCRQNNLELPEKLTDK